MKNFLNESDRNELISRIESLSPNAPAQWGKMNVNQMLCHLYDSLKVALGEIKPAHIGNFITRLTFVKRFVLGNRPFPKEKVETTKEVNPMKDGTKPVDFEEDKKRLLDFMRQYSEKSATIVSPEHPILGSFSKEDWARQIYQHTDHHLRQFGA